MKEGQEAEDFPRKHLIQISTDLEKGNGSPFQTESNRESKAILRHARSIGHGRRKRRLGSNSQTG